MPSPTTRTIPVHAPYDRSVIGEAVTADQAAIERALAGAHALFRDRDAWLPAPRRIEILERAQALLRERGEELAVFAAREGGKPLVDSRVEVARAADSLKICVETLRTQAGEVVPMGVSPASANRIAFSQHEPVDGVDAGAAFHA